MLASCSHDGIQFHLKFATVDQELSGYPQEFKALDLAKRIGWRSALESAFGPDTASYSTDPQRSKFLDVLPLAQSMCALEIGIGLGQHTVELAKRVSHLDAIEMRLVNTLFAKERCHQQGVRNVVFHCGGDDCLLPFADQTYDAVILNLVLEWCGSANNTEPNDVSQRRLLREIHRVLKPGGFVQISTKNRYALRLLVGGRDEHTLEMPFGSALPRPILRLLSRRRAPGLLHSYSGLRRMLAAAGLKPERSYWAAPEMRYAEHFVPTDAASVAKARRTMTRQGPTRLTNRLMKAVPAGLVKYVAPGLFFVAVRPPS